MPEVRDERTLTQVALTKLLEWLDDGSDSQGERYLEVRRRLVSYFDRRGRPFADELADETFNRIGRTLEESGSIIIRPPARYCYVVARFVLMEDIRRGRRTVPMDLARVADPVAIAAVVATVDDELSRKEQRLACLERCLQNLRPEQRQLALDYYRDVRREKIARRLAIATRLGITMNALGIRACRIRDTLETCVEACCTSGRRISSSRVLSS